MSAVVQEIDVKQMVKKIESKVRFISRVVAGSRGSAVSFPGSLGA